MEPAANYPLDGGRQDEKDDGLGTVLAFEADGRLVIAIYAHAPSAAKYQSFLIT